MNPLLHLIKFGSKRRQSHSVLIDLQQIYIRNAILFCTGLSMVRVLFGDTIHCQNTERSLSQTFVDTTCFINGTMTIGEHSTLYHDYYQWVSVYLLMLAFGFYLPYSVWSKWCGDCLRHLEALAQKPEEAIQVIKDSNGHYLFVKTMALEIFYVLYLILLLILTDVFFNRLWSQLGWSWKAVYVIFPDGGTCFFTFFLVGDFTVGRYYCLLPMCSVYRKVFLALYMLFVALMVTNVFILSYRAALAFQKRNRVNEWWALTIVSSCALSWDAKKKINCERRNTMQRKKETQRVDWEEECIV